VITAMEVYVLSAIPSTLWVVTPHISQPCEVVITLLHPGSQKVRAVR
jgi:hypothetical protein